jgi:hypothetical protein
MSGMKRTSIKRLALVALTVLLIAPAPAWAQKDSLGFGETLGSRVIRAGESPTVPAAPAPTPKTDDTMKMSETVTVQQGKCVN